jgi:hypothetical protein
MGIIEMHATVSKILYDHSIIQSDSVKSTNAMQTVVREVLQLQEKFISVSNKSEWTIEGIVKNLKSQLD